MSQAAKNLLKTLTAINYQGNSECQKARIKEWVPELCRMRSVPQEIKELWKKIAAAL